ncbi:MAG: SHOCT domain-containing protein [Gammaproteobacteria bacterium]|nr:MAG: SHOCT domain-containing protein [Gammaproteobacteria bacterium]
MMDGMGTLMGNTGTFGNGSMGFGWILMILFWGLVILGIVALLKWLSTRSADNSPSRTAKTALEILEERYARGEIERQEFEQKKRDLGS